MQATELRMQASAYNRTADAADAGIPLRTQANITADAGKEVL
jgi:hypothetical protein